MRVRFSDSGGALLADFRSQGEKVKDIPVTVSYEIINLFSGQLYQSPSKAVEELVANSYDAHASRCHVIVPSNPTTSSRIVVYDDGTSMDVGGLEDLWTIARSKKRIEESAKRPPIGRFGIGKLATYVLANELTYVTKRGGRYLAVTMDYRKLDPSSDRRKLVVLPVRELEEMEAVAVLALPELQALKVKPILFGREAPETWTVAILSSLKQKAVDLKLGRLRWVLSTALPNTPDFKLFLNGERVVATKETVPLMKRWTIGEEDQAAEALHFDTRSTRLGSSILHEVEVPGLGPISGTSELYEDTLTTGKSTLLGRSHGIFVMVRGRLINHDDPAFGMPPLSHQTFNRYRLVVRADGLDNFLVASREGVMDAPPVEALRDYIRAKFNETRAYLTSFLKQTEYEQRLTTKIGALPAALVGRPLRNLVEQGLEGEPSRLVRLPASTEEGRITKLEAEVKESRAFPKSLLRDVQHRPLGAESPLAVFDAAEGTVLVNSDHPFYSNYGDSETIEILAVAEVLSESYLRDLGVSHDVVSSFLETRDSFFRHVVSVRPISATQIATRLREAHGDAALLREAAEDALRSLGLQVVSRIGPEVVGKAHASLGYLSESHRDESYDVRFAGVVSGVDAVKRAKLTLDALRSAEDEDYALLIVGRGAENALPASQTAGITVIRAGDLADLVEAKASRFLSLHKLREVFASAADSDATREWIDQVIHMRVKTPPISELLNVIYELQLKGKEQVDLGQVKQYKGILADHRKQEIATWLSGIQSLVPTLVLFDGMTGHVELHAPPNHVLQAIAQAVRDMPDPIGADVRARMDKLVADLE